MNLGHTPDNSSPTYRRPRSPLRLIGAVAAVGLLAAGPIMAAQAHSELVSSNPPAGATIRAVPQQVTLTFNQEISARFATVTVAFGSGAPIRLTPAVDGGRVTAEMATPAARMNVNTRTAATITYRVVSADGHPISGAVTFTVVTPPTRSPTPAPSVSAASGEVAIGNEVGTADGEDTDGVSMTASALVVGPLVLSLIVGIIALVRRRGAQR